MWYGTLGFNVPLDNQRDVMWKKAAVGFSVCYLTHRNTSITVKCDLISACLLHCCWVWQHLFPSQRDSGVITLNGFPSCGCPSSSCLRRSSQSVQRLAALTSSRCPSAQTHVITSLLTSSQHTRSVAGGQ